MSIKKKKAVIRTPYPTAEEVRRKMRVSKTRYAWISGALESIVLGEEASKRYPDPKRRVAFIDGFCAGMRCEERGRVEFPKLKQRMAFTDGIRKGLRFWGKSPRDPKTGRRKSKLRP